MPHNGNKAGPYYALSQSVVLGNGFACCREGGGGLRLNNAFSILSVHIDWRAVSIQHLNAFSQVQYWFRIQSLDSICCLADSGESYTIFCLM